MRLRLSHEIWAAGSLFAVSVEHEVDLRDDRRLMEAREQLSGHSRPGEDDEEIDENRGYFVQGSPVVSCYQRRCAITRPKRHSPSYVDIASGG